MTEPLGLLVVDKETGPTSHDVVDAVRRLFGIRKVGHSGTLDPLATGVLLVGLGRATRLLAFLQGLPKEYTAEVQFGVTTSTFDSDGEVVDERPCRFDKAGLEAVLDEFTGEIRQLPPMFSAVKVGGRPLHELARKGEEAERSPKQVHVYESKLDDFDSNTWRARMSFRCSSGTYIRSLAADIGERLECGAHLTSLRRTSIGSFGLGESATLAELEAMSEEDRLNRVLSPAAALRDFPTVRVGEDDAKAVSHGRPLQEAAPSRAGELPLLGSRGGKMPPHQAGMTTGVPVAVVNEEGTLLAVYRRSASGLKPAAVLEGAE